MNNQSRHRRVSIEHDGELIRWTNQQANIANLSTTLRIERRAIEHQLTLITLIQRLDFVAFDNCNDLRVIHLSGLVALENGSRQTRRELRVNRVRLRFDVTFLRSYGLLKLLKRRIERMVELL